MRYVLNLIRRINYVLYNRRKGVVVPLSTDFVNPQNIYLGKNCIIELDCYFKAGNDNRPYITIGDKVIIKRRSRISTGMGIIKIGDYCYFGQNAWIGGKGNIVIGNNSIFAMNIVVISSNHDYKNVLTPYYESAEICKDIHIGENVWVGANCVILPGAFIEDGSVISAGSVVHGIIPQNTIARGNPAKVIRKITRKTDRFMP